MLHAFSGPTVPPHTQPRFFSAPSAGRRILTGFSYLQRIGKGATTKVWFPERLIEKYAGLVEWAAVRQVEILQEAGNLSIEDLDVEDMKRAYQALMKMRAGGYRVTIITLGHYTDEGETDDLCLLDQKIQEEITRLIHFLYLSEESDQQSAKAATDIAAGSWNLTDALPHVAQAMGAARLFKPHKQSLTEKTFFEIMEKLPSKHVIHETAVGLMLPDATKEKNWVYLAKDENKFIAFQRVIGTVLGNLDRDMPVMRHMRGYGDRLTPGHEAARQAMALKLAA